MAFTETTQGTLQEFDTDPKNQSRDVADRERHVDLGTSPYGYELVEELEDENEADLQYEKDECQSCGRSQTARIRRVLGDNNDVLWRCFKCTDHYLVQQFGHQPELPDGKTSNFGGCVIDGA